MFFPRNLKTELAYRRYRRQLVGGCGFCEAHEQHTEQVVSITGSLMILKNRFPYARWDNWKVYEHLMVIPVRHVSSIAELRDDERQQFITCIAEYEASGYSFYIRSHTNKSKSMPHLHGHFIKSK